MGSIKTNQHDIVIVGAGLAGLTAAYYAKKIDPKRSVLVIERSGSAGGLTGSWTDHRFGPDKKLQMPMHMIFRDKYPNLVKLVQEIGGELSTLFSGYRIITSDATAHRLEMNDWTARMLPPPLHGLGMFSKLKMPLRAKWDMLKLALVSTYSAREVLRGVQEPKLMPNTMSLECLELLLGMGPVSRDFMESITPSIFNLHPWYTSAPRIAAVLAGTMTVNRDSLHYHVFGRNYNPAFIDRFVDRLRAMGVEFSFWTEARRIDASADGSRVEALWIKNCGPGNSARYICRNCGAENHALDRALCTRCGLDTTLALVRDGTIKKPAPADLWREPEECGCEKLSPGTLITAMYPQMIARLLPEGSPLRRHPGVRSFFSSRARQTQLSIARVYYRGRVTRGEMMITGTHNPAFAFNGCQSVLNNFGAEDLGYAGGDVIDVLLDVGVVRDAHSHDEQKKRIVSDLARVYPDADPSLVEHVSFADIYPEVLYLSDQPAIAGLHRFYNGHRTGAGNWFVAGCHSGLIGIGMESAVQSAMSAVNCMFENTGESVKINRYEMHPLSRAASYLGQAILWWKVGRHPGRMAGTRYSER